jgi:hypothetical protein
MALGLRTGVLVVGSLDWESRNYGEAWTCAQQAHRVAWRQERLMDDEATVHLVQVPIRYGRLSSSRSNTFTMVISPERIERPGIGKAIRCRRDVTGTADLIAEAEALWKAESDQEGRVSASWGCVALVTPENFLEHPDADARSELLAGWAERVSRRSERHYGYLAFSARDRQVAGRNPIKAGRLNIPWPRRTDGAALPLDMLLVTVTDPRIGSEGGQDRYPTPQELAAAWNANGCVYYFRCNRLSGIQTADDAEIEKLLT